MSAISLQGNAGGTGTLTVAAPNTNTNRTLTLPDNTGTFMVNGPAFSTTMSANQSVTANTFTKVNFNTEEFDTNSNYDTSTYRFTPTVAGYYQISAAIYPSTTTTAIICYTYKNGSVYRGGAGTSASAVCTCLIYMNGSTDYVEIYSYLTGTSPVIANTSSISYFQGVLVRGA